MAADHRSKQFEDDDQLWYGQDEIRPSCSDRSKRSIGCEIAEFIKLTRCSKSGNQVRS